MKLNSTATFTLVLLVLMVGAGIFSATTGYSIGSDALKGVTQPDSQPHTKSDDPSSDLKAEESKVEGMPVLKEEEILKEVKEQMNAGSRGSSGAKAIDQEDTKNDDDQPDRQTAKFPFIGQDRGIKLEVNATRRQGDMVVFDVSIQNESNQPVKFLYSFLSITDDEGRILTGETAGLPSELPPKSERYTGTVRLSSSLLENARKVSLQLSDYPNQQVQLEVQDIPVK